MGKAPSRGNRNCAHQDDPYSYFPTCSIRIYPDDVATFSHGVVHVCYSPNIHMMVPDIMLEVSRCFGLARDSTDACDKMEGIFVDMRGQSSPERRIKEGDDLIHTSKLPSLPLPPHLPPPLPPPSPLPPYPSPSLSLSLSPAFLPLLWLSMGIATYRRTRLL
jgi:hypothetical protein